MVVGSFGMFCLGLGDCGWFYMVFGGCAGLSMNILHAYNKLPVQRFFHK